LFTAPAPQESSIFKSISPEINTHADFFHSGTVLAFTEASCKGLISFNVVLHAAILLLRCFRKKNSSEVE